MGKLKNITRAILILVISIQAEFILSDEESEESNARSQPFIQYLILYDSGITEKQGQFLNGRQDLSLIHI